MGLFASFDIQNKNSLSSAVLREIEFDFSFFGDVVDFVLPLVFTGHVE